MNAPDRKIRVCFIIPRLAPGGTERQLLYLLKGLQHTHDCTVICTRGEGLWTNQAQSYAKHVYELNTLGGWDPRIRARAARIFQSVQPDIVQTFLFGLELPVIRAARDAQVPVVVSSRRELAAWMKPRHLRAQRKANVLVDRILANSQAVARFAAEQEGLGQEQIHVVYNGINVESFSMHDESQRFRGLLKIPREKKIVGMVANFSEVKDHALFLDVAQVLMKARSDLHFLLIGQGPMQHYVENNIRTRFMRRYFTILWTLDDSASLLRIMDVSVLTSKREGFPNAILEAMALGRPVVAAAVGGVPELVSNETTGLLVASREPSEFADAIRRCLDNGEFAADLGARAKEAVLRDFPVDRMVSSYKTHYDELLTVSRARR